MVITDVTNKMIMPTVVSPLAFDANWFRYLKIWLLICDGIRCTARKSCSDAWNEAKIGNAVNSANATVASGTSESTVVNVRLPATCATRSSPVRRATKPASRFVVSRSMGNFCKNHSPQALHQTAIPRQNPAEQRNQGRTKAKPARKAPRSQTDPYNT